MNARVIFAMWIIALGIITGIWGYYQVQPAVAEWNRNIKALERALPKVQETHRIDSMAVGDVDKPVTHNL